MVSSIQRETKNIRISEKEKKLTDVFAAIKSHALANPGILSIQMMLEYLQNVILPWMAKVKREKHGNHPQNEDGGEIV